MTATLGEFVERFNAATTALAAITHKPGETRAGYYTALAVAEHAVADLYMEMATSPAFPMNDAIDVHVAAYCDASNYRRRAAKDYEQWARDEEKRAADRLAGGVR